MRPFGLIRAWAVPLWYFWHDKCQQSYLNLSQTPTNHEIVPLSLHDRALPLRRGVRLRRRVLHNAEQPGRVLRHRRSRTWLRVQRRAARVREPHPAGRDHNCECGMCDLPGFGMHEYEHEHWSRAAVVQPSERVDRSTAVVELWPPAGVIKRRPYLGKLVSGGRRMLVCIYRGVPIVQLPH